MCTALGCSHLCSHLCPIALRAGRPPAGGQGRSPGQRQLQSARSALVVGKTMGKCMAGERPACRDRPSCTANDCYKLPPTQVVGMRLPPPPGDLPAPLHDSRRTPPTRCQPAGRPAASGNATLRQNSHAHALCSSTRPGSTGFRQPHPPAGHPRREDGAGEEHAGTGT